MTAGSYADAAGLVGRGEVGVVHRDAVDVLSAQGLVYGCDCTRKEIEDYVAAVYASPEYISTLATSGAEAWLVNRARHASASGNGSCRR